MTKAMWAWVFLFVLAGLAASGGERAPRAHPGAPTAQEIRTAFLKTWQARSTPPAERAGVAKTLYEDVWLGWRRISVRLMRHREPIPKGATAEDILAGKYGALPSDALWSWTNRLCLDLFVEQHPTVISLAGAEIRGARATPYKALALTRELRHHLYQKGAERLPDGAVVLKEREARILEAMQETLFPILTKKLASVPGGDATFADMLAQGLSDLDDPRAIPVLLGKTPERSIKKHFEKLRSLQRRRKAHPRLIELLSHPDKEVRWRAAHALTESRDPGLHPHVRKLLRDPAPEVRKQALHIACFLPGKWEGELYEARAALLRDSDSAVRLTCARLFAREGNPACAGTLLDLLRDPAVKRAERAAVVQDVRLLTGRHFRYDTSSGASSPTTEKNRAAIAKFEKWVNAVAPLDIRPLPWPDALPPRGFGALLTLARLSPEGCQAIVKNANFTQATRRKNVKLATAREACDYLNHNLNMACAPAWVTVYRRKGEPPVYIFSGGDTAYPVRDFSRGVVVSQSGQIAGYTLPQTERRPRPPRVKTTTPEAFLKANPNHRERVGGYYVRKYLPTAVEQLARRTALTKEERALAEGLLRDFIYAFADATIAGGGAPSAKAHEELLRTTDARFRKGLSKGNFQRYLIWRKDMSGGNALAFLFCYNAGPPSERHPGIGREGATRSLRIPFKELTHLPAWQKPPEAPGVLLPFPGTRWPFGVERIGGRLVAGTPGGLLRSAGADRWEVVPHLCGRSVRVIGQSDGLLWVVLGPTDVVRRTAVAALDPTNLSIRRRLPDVRGEWLAVTPNRVWALDDRRLTFRDGLRIETPRSGGATRLVEYDGRGRELRRLRTDGKELPRGLVRWMTVDDEAVWLVLIDAADEVKAHGLEHAVVVRLSRKDGGVWRQRIPPLGLHVPTMGRPAACFAALPGRIVWLASQPHAAGVEVRQLDKRSLKGTSLGNVEMAGIRDRRGYQGLAADGKNLWVFVGGPHVFSLDALRPVPLEEAGDPPTSSPGGEWLPARLRRSLAGQLHRGTWSGGDERLWVLGSDHRLYELPDDGPASVRYLFPVIGACRVPSQLLAVGTSAYVHANGLVLRIDSGSEAARRLRVAPRQENLHAQLLGTERRLWLVTLCSSLRGIQRGRLIIEPDLSAVRPFELPERVHAFSAPTAALGGSLYVAPRALPYSGQVLRIDGATGSSAPLKARPRHAQGAGVSRLHPLPDGRLGVGHGPVVWLYDPSRHRWELGPGGSGYQPIIAGHQLYGAAYGGGKVHLVQWRGDGWQSIGRLPPRVWANYAAGSVEQRATQAHLYIRGPLGMRRIPWPSLTALARRDQDRPAPGQQPKR